jgi:hypothetical protein
LLLPPPPLLPLLLLLLPQGHQIKRLLSLWQPLLTEAIADEQRQILDNKGRGQGGRKDRPHYGPYLLLLEPQDLAHITLQSECGGRRGRVGWVLKQEGEGWMGHSSCHTINMLYALLSQLYCPRFYSVHGLWIIIQTGNVNLSHSSAAGSDATHVAAAVFALCAQYADGTSTRP